MRSKVALLAALLVFAACLALAPVRPASAQGAPAWAQGVEHSGKVVVPDSSIEWPEDVGRRAHTNHVIFLRGKGGGGITIPNPSGETPSSLGCVYQIVSPLTNGCPVEYDKSMPNPSGGGGVIALVDAYDYATAENDLNVFSAQFGLPSCTTSTGCFKVVYAGGKKPRANCGWAQEAALDIEWAHAMAPNASIVLVEAASNSFSDLFKAVDVAFNEVICGKATTCAGGSKGYGQVSMSWGGSEFSSEADYDSHFNKAGVVFFAASGDTGGKTIYPGTSPYVVAAGGTSVNRDSNGRFSSETAWSGSGGGPSAYEISPSTLTRAPEFRSTTAPRARGLADGSPSVGPAFLRPRWRGLSTWWEAETALRRMN
jgi:kumamolisin